MFSSRPNNSISRSFAVIRLTRKDFGIVGFHQEKFASYLVFPKRLPKIDEARVIGINYGLLRQPMAKPEVKKIHRPTSPGRESFVRNWHSTRDGAVKMESNPKSALPLLRERADILRLLFQAHVWQIEGESFGTETLLNNIEGFILQLERH
jgi:hypothetical protein